MLGVMALPVWLLVPIGFFLALCLYSWHKQKFFSRRGIPTKKTTLILGDLPLILKKGLGYLTVDDIMKNGKVFGTFAGNLASLIIADVEIIKLMMTKEFPNFTNRPSTPFPMVKDGERLLPDAVDDNWRLMRTSLSPAFSISKIKPMEIQINHCLKKLELQMNEHAEKHPKGFDIMPLLKKYTLDVILSVGFSVETNTQGDPDNDYVKHALGFLEFNPINPSLMLFFIIPELKHVAKFLKINPFPPGSKEFYDRALTAMMEQRREMREPTRKDLLELMMDAQRKQVENCDTLSAETPRISDQDIKGNAVICMIAGYDTTSSCLAWFLYDMITNPQCQDSLIAEIDQHLGQEDPSYASVFRLQYLDMVLSETLRFHPPGSNIIRVAKEEIELCGITIPKGVEISIPLTALHFMPEHWENPNQYIPERFAPENKGNIESYAYLPFGLGPRNCVANRLAMFELKMTIASIFQKFRLRKSDDLQVPLPSSRMLVISPAAPVSIIAERRFAK